MTQENRINNMTAAGMEDLFNQGMAAAESKDLSTAKKIGLQIMVGASMAMSEFLEGDNSIEEQALAACFSFSWILLNRANAHIPAIRCFYNAQVFQMDWLPDEIYGKTAVTLWENILLQKPDSLLKDRDKMYELLDTVFSTAQLARTRHRFHLAALICDDLVRVHNQLFICYRIMLRGIGIEPLKRKFITKVKAVVLCHAGSLYEMKRYAPVKRMCADVLKNMSEYDNVEALELWGRALFQEKEFTIAEKKIILALENTKEDEETEARLNNLLCAIKTERDAMLQNDVAVDPSWLEGTSAEETGKHTPTPEPSTVATEKKKKIVKKKQFERYPQRPQVKTTVDKSKSKQPVPEVKPAVVSNNGKGPFENRTRYASECSNKSTSTVGTDEKSLYSSSWTDSEDDNEDTTSVSSSTATNYTAEEEFNEEVYDEDTNFYEQSCRFYQDRSESDAQMLDQTLLKCGLELNMSFMHRFEEMHNKLSYNGPFYDEFVNKDALRERMLKQPDTFIRCKIHIQGSHLSYGIPIDTSSNIDIVEISGRSKAGQTYNEDDVVVQLLDSEHKEANKRYGKVIGIWERKRYQNVKHPVFLCTLDDMETHLVRPMCKTVPKIHILTDEIMKKCPKMKKHKIEIYTYDNISATLSDPKLQDINPTDLNKHVFLVALIHWNKQFIYPRGAIIRILPFGASLQRGFALLNLKHEVPSLYQKPVVDKTESIWRRCFDGPRVNMEDRNDLTDLKVFTIDPPGARDLDDALSVENLEDGFKVGVHIADVSHFVEKDDPIDQEAAARTTTFYPGIDGKLPRSMLPEPLSANLCSLLPGKQRRTLSVFFHLTGKGRLKQMSESPIEIKKTIIQSCEQFTYREVQDILDKKKSSSLQDKIHVLFQLATHIRKERLKNSMYALDIADDQSDTDESDKETLEAHYLVEEFMIMANKAVAEKLLRTYPDRVPLRCQPSPSVDSMMEFLKKHSPYVDTLVKLQDKPICDYKIPCIDSLLGTTEHPVSSNVIVPKHVWSIIISGCSTSVSRLVLTDDLFPLQHLVHQNWLDIQKRAEYKCSNGIKNKASTLHFSLQIHPYTHFTSPIRRYIDLVVHRLLHAALKRLSCPYSKSDIDTICSHTNSTAQRAKDYQRECKNLKQAIDLSQKPKMVTCFIDEVSDRNVTLSSPDLKHVPSVHKALAFNLLDVAYKPDQCSDTTTGADLVTVTWRKRLYDSRGIPTNVLPASHYRDDNKVLNPNPGVVFIPLQKWARILKCTVEGRMTDLKRVIKNTHHTEAATGFTDVSTECLEEGMMQPNTKFSMTFKRGQSIKVQIAALPWRGMLTPRPVLFDMTNNIKFCIQHTDDPVLHLSRYSTRSTCDQYANAKLYLERWIPLLEMEAACNAVTNEESCVINNVPIRFENAIEGRICLPSRFCLERNIEFSGIILDDADDLCDESAKSYDWLCLRYVLTVSGQNDKEKVTPTLNSVWNGHASVTSVIKKTSKEEDSDGKIVVRFRLHSQSPLLPDEAKGRDSKFSVEILRKSEVDRRTEAYMKQLPSMDSTLAHTIALNKGPVPVLANDHVQMAEGIERDLTIPADDDVRLLPKNNKRQQEAIDKALVNRFTLIQGPPGTGKTYTGIKLLYLFDKINGMIAQEGGPKHQVLFCGPSNKSVDLVARTMLKRLGSLCPNFVRVYGRSIEAIDYPIPGRTFLSKKSTRDQKADPELNSVALHHLIRQKGKQYAEEINAFDRRFRESNYAPQPPEEIGKYVHIIREASIDEIRKHDIILCTTAVGANPKILKASNVFQVIIDEAGMCPEPQCLVPIIATKAEQVVLIGDHKQLRPIIKCKQAAELGLDISLFQRYAEPEPENVPFTMLETQYRMNPQLCRFPSKQFYDGDLHTESGLWHRGTMDIWPKRDGKSYPHVFIPVEGEEKSLTVSTEEGNEHSRSNQLEIEIVVKLFRYFIDEGIGDNEIKVISQYNAQCSEIKARLHNEGFTNYNVSTVVSSQGGEWDYVIFSTVRSLPDYKIEKHPTLGWCKQNLGFITDENQINVALTRARKGLVIVGNPKLLRCDRVWGRLITQYENKDCVCKDGEFPPPPRTRRQRLLDAQRRNMEIYGEDRFTRGQATSYDGDFDNCDDDSDNGSGFRRMGRRNRGRGRFNPGRRN